MGDLQPWLPHQNGILADFSPPPPPLLAAAQPLNPHPSEIGAESWRAAEKATAGVIEEIQATVVSERRRRGVIEFVQNMIKCNLNAEVFPFGSVPLKTYLPDGDIDLTALGFPNSEDTFASSVRQVLELQEQNNNSEFEVKDVQYIHAEVKLVKCLIQNIVVDISFNQSGGLSTLCFLEQVDRMIGKDHLFKRSIILIKAWCYYESRILGAHHALISTYALETLILYIFHLFNKSLDGPLVVLYRFLDYYSKFDWDRYCISLRGPILISSLPELVAEVPVNHEGGLLFTKEFLNKCVDDFSVPPRGSESVQRNFPRKHLNIVDPLKDNNNLGRSVSRGNFYRIRSAFSFGARKLGQILLLPSESIADEVNVFFGNTLDRHGSGERPDVQDAGSLSLELQSHNTNEELCQEINTMNISGSEKNARRMEAEGQIAGRGSKGFTSRGSSSINIGEKSKVQVSTSKNINSPKGKPYHMPHLFFHSQNGYQNDSCERESSTTGTSRFSPRGSPVSSWSNEQSKDSHIGVCSNGASGSAKSNRLANLSGDLDIHMRNLQFVQWTQDYMMGNLLPFYPPSPYQYRNNNNNSWDPPQRRGAFSRMNANGVPPGPPFSPTGTYPTPSPFIPGGVFGIDHLPKPRGTGTYFPNTNYHAYKERVHSPGRGKSSVPPNHFSRQYSNGRARASLNVNLEESGVREQPSRVQLPAFTGSGSGKSVPSDASNMPSNSSKETLPATSSVVPPPEGDLPLEFGSFGPASLSGPAPEANTSLDSGNPPTPGLATISVSTMRGPSMSSNRERSAQAYRLKDEGDFPPLSG
ncbi:uncharacterized protein LOC109819490 [Asparagus officinalis]|uniref:uncharacterized protein LOC109819490 n=1 Tax=Asparagus officinalis TaxID=4686 RepID=UPI00098E823B|nr:uncharacterized protein LOC109819490 [Asparagus officinalis]